MWAIALFIYTQAKHRFKRYYTLKYKHHICPDAALSDL